MEVASFLKGMCFAWAIFASWWCCLSLVNMVLW